VTSLSAVVIGASAGGIEALGLLLPALRQDAEVAVLVVVHLPRERRSLLADIFAPKCGLRVVEADDKEPIEPGTIYFAPPDYHLLVDAGPRISLSSDEPVHFSRPAIDVLFESAADFYRERLLGLVLTGANEDGAAGLAAVGRGGGLTFVQEPATASASAMPLAACRAVPASTVLDLPALAKVLGSISGAVLPSAPRTDP